MKKSKIERPKPPVANIVLPKEPTVNFERSQSEVCILYGPRKIGKTWLACSFPKPLILDLEGGARFLEYHPKKNEIYLLQINTVGEMRGAVKALLTEKDDIPYETIIVDSITLLNHWIEKEVERELGTVFGSAGFAKDYASARSKVMDIVEAIRKVPGKRIILIGHSSIASSEDESYMALELTGKVKALAASLADWLGLMQWNKQKERVLVFPTDNTIEGGSRYPQLVGKTIPATYESVKATIGGEYNENKG